MYKKILTVLAAFLMMFCAVAAVNAGASESDESDFGFDAVTGTITHYYGSSKDVVIPETIGGVKVNEIGKCAFEHARFSNVTIPQSVTVIGERSFDGSQVNRVNILNRSVEIEAGAFSSCRNLTDVTIGENSPEAGNGSAIIGTEAFSHCEKLKTLEMYNNVKSIGDSAFYGTGLTSITLPSSVTTIGKEAFYFCLELTSAAIENSAASIGDGCFSHCYKLYSVKLPEGLTTIPTEMFVNCPLGDFSIPESVTSIGKSAFSNCFNLTEIKIPSKVTTIEAHAFTRCLNLKSITMDDSVKAIGEYAFAGCISLKDIKISSSIEAIERRTFDQCQALESIIIGDKVKSIGEAAFNDCSGLVSITIPKSVTSIGKLAFYNCTSLTDIKIDKDNLNYSSLNSIIYDKKKTTVIAGYGVQGKLTLPGSVITISEGAFKNCTALLKITFPSSLKIIGDESFCGSGLQGVSIPKSVKTVGKQAFAECRQLAFAKLPDNLKEIGKGAFASCDVLGNVNLPVGLTVIPDALFIRCYKLKNVTIPSKVVKIGSNCFRFTALAEIEIPDSVTIIGDSAFADCSSLADVKIGENVERLGIYSFTNSPITSITIPESVKEIGGSAFESCSKLNNAFFEGNAPKLEDTALEDDEGDEYHEMRVFSSTTEDFTIYYKKGSKGFEDEKFPAKYYKTLMIMPAKGYVEEPASGKKISGEFEIKGYFLDVFRVSKIEVLIDGKVVGQALLGIARQDILEKYPMYKNESSGFSYTLDTTQLKNGTHKLVIRETNGQGKRISLEARKFVISNN